jgi:two-component system response regulator YesN
MIKILLVDDEVTLCSGMKKLIHRVGGEFFVVAEAYDGVEALDMIKTFDPDILLTDMKMPRMDGMQLLGEAKKLKPDLLTAVVSAYSDYHYIRDAMLMHTSDYLLKPVTAKDLQELLQKLQSKFEQLVLRKEQETLKMLLHGRASVHCPSSMQYSHYTLLLVCAGPYNNGLIDDCPGEVFWHSPIFADCLEFFERAGIRHWLLNGERSNERLVLLAANRENAEECINKGLENFLQNDLSEQMPVTFLLESKLMLNQLAATSKQLRRELLHSLVFGKSSILILKDSSQRMTHVGRSFTNETAKVMEVSRLNRYEPFAEELKTLLECWETCNATQYAIQQALFRLLTGFGQHGLERLIDMESVVSRSINYFELWNKLSVFFNLMFQSQKDTPPLPKSFPLVEQVEQFLKKNFRDAITLQSLSQEFGLVPNYLSVLFKREKGLTPGEFLMEFRIKEAKRIMDEQPHLLLKQVAGEVGYSDQLYFSRVFKKLTGQSPTEYVQSRQQFNVEPKQ